MQARYDRFAVFLHWAIGLALLGQIAFGLLLDEIAPRGTPSRGMLINLHKSCGLVLLVLILARLAWRLRHAPPPWPASLPGWQQRIARATHIGLYACMLVSPLSGLIASNFSAHGLKFFGLAVAPLGPDLPAVYRVFNQLHDIAGWCFAALVALHIAAALKHLAWDRDGVFGRMSLRHS